MTTSANASSDEPADLHVIEMADLGRVDAIGMLKHRLGMLGRSVTGEQLRAVESGIEQHRRKDRTGSAMWLALAAQVGLRSSCARVFRDVPK